LAYRIFEGGGTGRGSVGRSRRRAMSGFGRGEKDFPWQWVKTWWVGACIVERGAEKWAVNS